MASLWDDMAADVDAVDFEVFGDPAVYRPATGDPIDVRVVRSMTDAVAQAYETRVRRPDAVVVDLQASQVAAPAQGDRLDLGGVRYLVEGAPMMTDSARRIWTLDLKKETVI